MLDVMFYEAFEEEQKEIKGFLPEDVRAAFTSKTIQETEEKKPSCALISIRTQSRIPLSWAKSVDGILSRSQGFDHLMAFRRESDSDAACGYLGNYCARAVAEQAILMVMVLLRKFKKQEQQFVSFSRDGLTGKECQGRNVLIIGVGNIGSEMADMAKGLKMIVRGVDIAPKAKNIKYVSLSDGLDWADAALCALPLTDQTEGMLNYAALKESKPGLIFINIARGEISPVGDLKKLLEEEILEGVGMDVYAQEGAMANSFRAGEGGKTPEGRDILEMAKNENVIFTPHNAFNTSEALKKKASLTVTAIISYLKNRTFPTTIPSI